MEDGGRHDPGWIDGRGPGGMTVSVNRALETITGYSKGGLGREALLGEKTPSQMAVRRQTESIAFLTRMVN